MWERLKNFFDSSLTWILFLVACVLYLWKKEKHLENQLKEQQFDDLIKETKDAQDKADNDALDANADYERIKHAYLDQHGLGDGHGNDD